MNNSKQAVKENMKKNDNSKTKMIGEKTLEEWKIEFAKALHEEFKDDPEYQRRISKKTLQLKQCKLYPRDTLPKNIEDPKELLVKITKKIKINKKENNLSDCLLWVPLAESVLKRYSNIDDELTDELQSYLAKIFLFYSYDHNKAKKYYYKSYPLQKRKNGEEDRDTLRSLSHIAYILYWEEKYAEALKKHKKVYLIFNRRFGKNDKETLITKMNCALCLIKLKQDAEAVDYLINPFVITADPDIMILLSYEKKFMEAPMFTLSEKGSSAKRLIKIMEEKNVPIVKNSVIAKGIIRDCKQFEYLPPKYWPKVSKILAKILNDQKKKIK